MSDSLVQECIRIENLDLVFGNSPQSAWDSLNQGHTREETLKQTGQLVAVQSANLKIYEGETLVLMGLSGSGKSSLLRCINGMVGRGKGQARGQVKAFFRNSSSFYRNSDESAFVERTEGSHARSLRRKSGLGSLSFSQVFDSLRYRRLEKSKKTVHSIANSAESKLQPFESCNVLKCSPSELRHLRQRQIAMVFQGFNLMPWRSVFENIAFPLEVQKVPQEEQVARVMRQIKLVGLEGWKDRYPHELSGGMQQRVGLARAFVTDAPILLMDEPFSALDPLHRKSLQDEVIALQKEFRKTIVFVTHDFREAVRIASRIAVMQAGKILQVGTAEELSQAPAGDEVRQFTAEIHQ